MTCGRCHSAMVLETFVDLGSGGNPGAFLGWHCVACGSILDPLIAQHQHLRPAPSHERSQAHHKLGGRPVGDGAAASERRTRPG